MNKLIKFYFNLEQWLPKKIAYIYARLNRQDNALIVIRTKLNKQDNALIVLDNKIDNLLSNQNYLKTYFSNKIKYMSEEMERTNLLLESLLKQKKVKVIKGTGIEHITDFIGES